MIKLSGNWKVRPISELYLQSLFDPSSSRLSMAQVRVLKAGFIIDLQISINITLLIKTTSSKHMPKPRARTNIVWVNSPIDTSFCNFVLYFAISVSNLIILGIQLLLQFILITKIFQKCGDFPRVTYILTNSTAPANILTNRY